jgi:protein TonB
MKPIAARAWHGAAGQGTLASIAPADGYGRLPRSRWRTSLRVPLPLSALLHLALVLALLSFPLRQPSAPDVAEPGTVDVLMVPAGMPEAPAEQPPEPNPATPERPVPGLPPVPEVPPALPVASAPEPLPAPQEQPPAPLVADVPEPLPAPQEQPPAPSEPEEPTAPPVPAPRPPARPAPARPAPFPRPVARSFADLGADLSAAPPPEPPRPLPRGAMILAIGPEARASKGAVPINPDSPRGIVRIEGADLGADWERELLAWWDQHSFYPRQAVENDEEGTNRLRILMDRTGRVQSVELEMRSGSRWLDMGSLAIFRDAKLPPFPLSTPQNEATLHLTIDYILIHGRGG